MRAFARFSWAVLAYNLAVVAWGAYVRATGSGAGCGQHWPTCQGALVPRSPTMSTLVEYSHRLSSGLALLLVALLVVAALLTAPRGHAARRGAVASAIFLVLEALLGASLVIFGLVDKDASLARGIVMPIHLVNTFLLLASLALTAWFGSGGEGFVLRGQGLVGVALGLAVLGMVGLGISGAVTALGDTLFPMASLAQGWREDFSPAAHLFVRLRILHPTLAMVVGTLVAATALYCALTRPSRAVRRLAGVLVALFALQMGAGVVNLVLLAPVPMQLLHLLLADLTWVGLVLLGAASLATAPRPQLSFGPKRPHPRPLPASGEG